MTNELNEIGKALAKFHKDVPSIMTNKEVAYAGTKFKYANLCGILDIIRKPLAESGLSIVQLFQGGELITTLLHESGQSISSTIGLGITPTVDHKKLGAAISYMRRYALVSILNLAADEDEAEEPSDSVPITPAIKQADPVKVLTGDQIQMIIGLVDGDANEIKLITDAYKVSSLTKVTQDNYNFIVDNIKARKKKNQ